jgi:hypothetical protein
MSGGKTLWLTNGGIVFDNVRAKTNEHSIASPQFPSALRAPIRHLPDAYERLVFSEDFTNASSAPSIEGIGVQPGNQGH